MLSTGSGEQAMTTESEFTHNESDFAARRHIKLHGNGSNNGSMRYQIACEKLSIHWIPWSRARILAVYLHE